MGNVINLELNNIHYAKDRFPELLFRRSQFNEQVAMRTGLKKIPRLCTRTRIVGFQHGDLYNIACCDVV